MRAKHTMIVGLTLTAICAPALAMAQTPETVAAPAVDPASPATTTGDIIVTARRREESLQRVPVAVTALGGDDIQKLQVINVQDLTRAAPSVTIGASTRGGGVPFLSIRGISSADVNAGIDPSIGIYFNEVIQNRPNGVLSSLYDIGSVQVLRGPQGTLFGRNTVGGAILVNSRAPTDRLEGYGRGTIGNYDYRSVEGALNLPLAPWAKLRVAGRLDRRDGYVRSVTTGQDLNDLHNAGGRATLLLEPASNLSSTTIVSFYDQNANGTGVTTPGLYPVGSVSGGLVVNANSNVADAANRRLIAAAGALRRTNFYRNAANEIQEDRVHTFDVNNNTRFDLSDEIAIKNIFGYRETRFNAIFDQDGSAARQLTVGTIHDFRQYSEELQLIGSFGKLDFLAGLYYFKEAGTEFSTAFTSIPFAQINTPAAFSRTGGFVRNTSYSGFVNATYALTDRLKASAGVRYTKDRRHVDLRSVNISNPLTNPVANCNLGTVVSITPGAGPNGADVVVTTPANPCSLKRTETFSEPTYSVDLSWQASDAVLLYAAHRRGYHSGALNVRATYALPTDLARPEFLDDIEVGVKSRFNAGGVPMRLNVAGYYGWYKDIQRSVTFPAIVLNGVVRLPSGITNAAKAHIYGLEVEYNATPFRGFDINAFFAYNETGYDKYIDAALTPALDRSGDLFSYAPKYTAGATARYTFDIGSGGSTGAVQLNYFHTSKFNTTLGFQPVYTILPSYDLFNGRVEWNKVGGSGVDLAVFANNLFKKKYYTGGAGIASVGVAGQVPGAPRMYGLEATIRFGQ